VAVFFQEGAAKKSDRKRHQCLDYESAGDILRITEKQIGQSRADTRRKCARERAEAECGEQNEAVTEVHVPTRDRGGDLNDKSCHAAERRKEGGECEAVEFLSLHDITSFYYMPMFRNCTQYSTKVAKNQGAQYKFCVFITQ